MSDKGIQFTGDTIHTLAYADDAALLHTNVETVTARVTAITMGFKADTDV